MEIFITEILLVLAGIFKAVMDLIAHEKLTFLGKFFDPKESWKLKYKKGNIGKPRFFLSTTLLVWVTDAWHLFQSLYLNCIFLLMAYLSNYSDIITEFLRIKTNDTIAFIVTFIVLRFIFGYAFEISYRRIPGISRYVHSAIRNISKGRTDG